MADLIDRAALKIDTWERLSDAVRDLDNAPAVDAVEVPEGKRGDYVEWNNGTGYKSFHQIKAVTLEPDGNFRYLFETFHPLVNHNGIIRIISADEMNRMMGAKR